MLIFLPSEFRRQNVVILGFTDKFASRYVVQYVCLPVLCSFCTAGKSCLLPPVVTLKWFSSHYLRPAAPPRPHRSHSHSHRRGWKIIRLWKLDRIFVNWWDGIRATFCWSTVTRSALDQYWKRSFWTEIFLCLTMHLLDDYYKFCRNLSFSPLSFEFFSLNYGKFYVNLTFFA